MGSKKRTEYLGWLWRLVSIRARLPKEYQQARSLIKAVDKGGLPMNPPKVNAIARDLGLEVSVKDPVEKTILRIRQALARVSL
jgi:hypothetical protein